MPEGDTVDVGVVLAVVGDAGAAPAPRQRRLAEEPAAAAAPLRRGARAARPSPRPPLPPPAPPVRLAAPAPAARADAGESGRLLSPVVRRLVAEHGLDPASITGTGVGGRITRNDVLAAAEAATRPPAPAPAPAAAPPPAPATPAPAPAAPAAPAGPLRRRRAAGAGARPQPQPLVRSGERDTVIPHSNIRRRSAEHLRRSLDTSAHVYASIEVDYEAVERVRRAHKDAWRAEEGFGLTYLPFISRAVIDAIHEFPEVNATFTDDALIVHNYLNLGIAVDLDFKGLMVPVVRDADSKRMRAIAREISDLAAPRPLEAAQP